MCLSRPALVIVSLFAPLAYSPSVAFLWQGMAASLALFAYCHSVGLLPIVYCLWRSVPDMPNIDNICTITGHRFGHQSGLDKGSGQISITFPHGIAFRVFVAVSPHRLRTTYTNEY